MSIILLRWSQQCPCVAEELVVLHLGFEVPEKLFSCWRIVYGKSDVLSINFNDLLRIWPLLLIRLVKIVEVAPFATLIQSPKLCSEKLFDPVRDNIGTTGKPVRFRLIVILLQAHHVKMFAAVYFDF